MSHSFGTNNLGEMFLVVDNLIEKIKLEGVIIVCILLAMDEDKFSVEFLNQLFVVEPLPYYIRQETAKVVLHDLLQRTKSRQKNQILHL